MLKLCEEFSLIENELLLSRKDRHFHSLIGMADHFELMTHHFSKLPIPKRNKYDIWDQISSTEASFIIDGLTRLSFNYEFLFKKISSSRRYSEDEGNMDFRSFTYQYFFQYAHAYLYSNLAIIDKLSRRCTKTGLGDQEIFFHFLIFQNHIPVDDPKIQIRISDLQTYFSSSQPMPVDETEFKTLAYSTLFYPIFDKENKSSIITCSTSRISYPEMAFLKKFIPLIANDQAFLSREGIEINQNHEFVYSENQKHVKEVILLSYLLKESFKLKSSCLPRAYCGLNIVCRLCQTLMISDSSTGNSCFSFNYFNETEQASTINFNFSNLMTLENFFWNLISPLVCLINTESRIEEYLEKSLYSKDYINNYFNGLKGDKREGKKSLFSLRDQHLIYENPNNLLFIRNDEGEKYIHSKFHEQQNQQFELIHTKPIDTPIRVMGYLKMYFLNHHIFMTQNQKSKIKTDYLRDFTDHLRHCQHQLFTGTSLKNQLQSTPAIAYQFGKIVSLLASHALRYSKKDIFFFLADFSLTLEKVCKEYAPDHCSSFPNIKELIESEEEPRDSKCKALFPILKALSIGFPEDVEDLKKNAAAKLIAQAYFLCSKGFEYRFIGSNILSSESQPNYHCGEIALDRKWAHQLRILYWHWLPLIREIAATPSQQDQFFFDLVGYIPKSIEKEQWKQEYRDRYRYGNYKVDLNLGIIYGSSSPSEYDPSAFEFPDESQIIHFVNAFKDGLLKTDGLQKIAPDLLNAAKWNDKFRENICSRIATAFKFKVNQTKWIPYPSDTYSFTNGDISINFLLQNVSRLGPEYDLCHKISDPKETFNQLIYALTNEARPIHSKINGVFADVTGEFCFTMISTHSFEVIRNCKNKSFKLIRQPQETLSYWLEATPKTQKELLVYKVNHPVASYLVEQLKITAILKDGLEYIPINDHKITSIFSGFCPPDQIVCWKLSNSNRLHQIDLLPFNLSFQIAYVGYQLRAYIPQLLPGYYLASNQFHPSLKLFSNYILLENDQKQKKVIFSHEEWKQSILSPILSQLGPLKSFFSPLLTQYFFNEKTKEAFPFEYFFRDQKENPKVSYSIISLEDNGELTSDAPDTLAYLILIGILHWDQKQVDRIVCQLESILKRQYIPIKTFTNLIQFLSLIPSNFLNISVFRRKLFAAIEENQSLYSQGNEKETNEFLALKIFCLYIDLPAVDQNKDPRYQLTADEEWRLFQALSISIFKVLITFPNFYHFFSTIQDTYIWEFFFTKVVLQGPLQDRYQVLKLKLDQKNSLTQHMANLILTMSTQANKSIDISLFIPESLLKSLQNLQPTIDTEKDWIDLFKVLIDSFSTPSISQKQDLELHYHPMHNLQIKNRWSSSKEFYDDFVYAYLIAKGRGSSEQFSKLKGSLQLHRGGWDEHSNLMIECLLSVMKLPFYFPEVPHQKKLLIWLNTINLCHHKIKIGEVIAQLTVKLGAICAISSCKNLVLPILSTTTVNLPLIGSFIQKGIELAPNLKKPLALAPAGSSLLTSIYKNQIVHRAFVRASKSEKKMIKDNPVEMALNRSIINEDKVIDAFLSKVYNETFNEITYQDVKIDPYPESQKSFNASLNDYYEKVGMDKFVVTLKNDECLKNMYQQISHHSNELNNQIEYELKTLLEVVNTQTNGLIRPVNFKDLVKYLLEGSFDELSSNLFIKPEHLPLIEKTMMHYIIKKTRLQQMQRILDGFEMLSRYHPDSEEYARQMELIITEINARRTYTDKDLSPRILKRVLIVELLTNKMVWSRQAHRIKDRFLQGDQLLEFIMGMGKTELLSLLENLVDADGSKIIFSIWPGALIHTNMRFLSKQSEVLFDQTVNHIELNKISTKKSYITIQHLLKRIQMKGETINQTKEEIQGLELMFIDYLDQARTKKNDKAYEIAKDIGKILLTMRKKGKAIGDEAHLIFDELEELLRASGMGEPIDLSDFKTIVQCVQFLVESSEVHAIIKENRFNDLSPDQRKEIVLSLAERLSLNFNDCIESPKKQKEFIAYITNESKMVPKWIESSKHARKIAMLKGVLTTHLPSILEQTINVDFGPSRQNPDKEFAFPYEANECAKEKSSIRHPHEAVLKTTFSLFYHGLSLFQISKLTKHLMQKATVEASKTNLELDQTPSGKLFLELTKTIPLSQAFNRQKEVEELLEHKSDAIFWYLENQVHPQMLFWKVNYRSNCHNFHNIFSTHDYKTGTPYNEKNLPDDITIKSDPGTLGEALHILENKSSDKPIHHLKNTEPKALLKEILQDFFQKGSRFTALIDGGAKLTGIDSYTVAKEMREFAKKYRPDIVTIDFFFRDESGMDKLMSWPIEADAPIPYDQCHTPLHQRLAYFDQLHGLGANLTQKPDGKALALIGLKHPIYRLLQEIFRMRGLKEFRFYVRKIHDNLRAMLSILNKTTTQQVEFGLTGPVAEAIGKSLSKDPKDITLRDIEAFADANQKNSLKMSHFISYKQKVSNIARRCTLDKLLESIINDSKDATLDIFNSAEDLLVSKVETDPIKLYQRIVKPVPIKKVVEGIQTASIAQAEQTKIFNYAEMKEIKRKIETLSIHPMPDFIQLPVDDHDNVDYLASDDLNLNVEVDTDISLEQNNNVDQEQEQQTEVQQETEVEQKTAVAANPSWHFQSGEDIWPDLNPYTLKWLQFSNPNQKSAAEIVNSFMGHKTPPLFLVRDLLNESPLKSISKAFSDKIWFSNHFLPTYTLLNINSVSICSKKQCDLLQVIVHRDKNTGGILSVGCLSQNEMAWWRNQLKKMESHPDNKVEAFLYDMQIRDSVAGTLVPLETLHTNRLFLEIEAQLKYLNADVFFDPQQNYSYSRWFQKYNPELLLKSFITIHNQRGKHPFEGSIVEITMKSLIEES